MAEMEQADRLATIRPYLHGQATMLLIFASPDVVDSVYNALQAKVVGFHQPPKYPRFEGLFG